MSAVSLGRDGAPQRYLSRSRTPRSSRFPAPNRRLRGLASVAIVETITKTPEVPFGDCFYNLCRFVMTAVGPTQTRMVVTGQVKFSKQTMFKGAPRAGAHAERSRVTVRQRIGGRRLRLWAVRQAKSKRRRTTA